MTTAALMTAVALLGAGQSGGAVMASPVGAIIASPVDTAAASPVGTVMASPLGVLFVNPLPFPAGARLWMMLPLVACVAVVYRATRTRSVRTMLRPTILTFVNIVVGMILIAVAFYGLHMFVRYVL